MLTSDHLVEVNLSPAFTSGVKVVTIKAHVIDSIVTDCPDQDLEAVKQMPFLKGQQLADPELRISGKIDLLLVSRIAIAARRWSLLLPRQVPHRAEHHLRLGCGRLC